MFGEHFMFGDIRYLGTDRAGCWDRGRADVLEIMWDTLEVSCVKCKDKNPGNWTEAYRTVCRGEIQLHIVDTKAYVSLQAQYGNQVPEKPVGSVEF